MRRFFLILGIAMLILPLLAACGTAEPTQAPDVENAAAVVTEVPVTVEPALPEGQFMAFVIQSQQDSFWQASRFGVKSKMEELGIKIEYLGPENENPEVQANILANLLTRNPVAIAVAPSDVAKITPWIDAAVDQGIKVITIKKDAPDSKRSLYIGTDNSLAGYEVGKKFAESIGGKGKIAIFHGSLASETDVERIDGFKKAIAEYPEIEIVTIVESIQAEGSTVIPATPAETLAQYPDLVGIFSATGRSAAEAALALQEMGKCGSVNISGFGAVQMGVELMRSGCINMFVTARPFALSTQAIDAMMGLVQGKTDLPEITDLGVTIVTLENLDEYLNSNN